MIRAFFFPTRDPMNNGECPSLGTFELEHLPRVGDSVNIYPPSRTAGERPKQGTVSRVEWTFGPGATVAFANIYVAVTYEAFSLKGPGLPISTEGETGVGTSTPQ